MELVNIRNFSETDRADFIEMCSVFFGSEATIFSLTKEQMNESFDKTLCGSPYIRGLIIEHDMGGGWQTVGYALLSFTYTNEAGGIVLIIEEIYIKDKYRGRKIGTAFFEWLFKEYDGRVKRYRLEVARENQSVIKLYEKMGFKHLSYIQMFKQL